MYEPRAITARCGANTERNLGQSLCSVSLDTSITPKGALCRASDRLRSYTRESNFPWRGPSAPLHPIMK